MTGKFTKIYRYLLGLCLLVAAITACSLQLSPVPSSQAVLGPKSVVERQNPVTTAPSANFLSAQQIQQSSAEQFKALARQHRWQGHKIMQPRDGDPRYQRLARIFDRVLSVSHLQNSDVFPVLISAPQFQAHTYGGDEVVFYTGLSESLNDEALAFVVAHELAHIAARHVAEATSLAVTNIDLQESLPRQNDLYSYGHEREADKIAIVYLLLAGYAPDGALSLWQKLTERQMNNGYDLFVATHPASADRARDLRENVGLFLQNSDQYDQANLLNCNPLYCSANYRD